MRAEWKFFLVGLIVSVSMAYFHFRNGEKDSPVMNATEQKSRQRVREVLASMEEKTSLESGSSVSNGTKRKLTQAFDFMIQARHSLHRDEERHAVLAKLVEDPAAVDAAAKYLQDPVLVKQHFADKQAEARIFSIDLLAERAKKGDAVPLAETTRSVAQELSSSMKVDAGRRRDLEDLIAAFVGIERESALDDLDKIISTLGYHPSLREPFTVGISIALQNTYSKEEILMRLEQVGIVVRKDHQG